MSDKKKRRARRSFDDQFKADVVRLCETESIAAVSKRLDLTATSVRAWVKQAKVDAGKGPPDAMTTDEKAELRRLKRELKRVTEERDILKKATAFFAKESS